MLTLKLLKTSRDRSTGWDSHIVITCIREIQTPLVRMISRSPKKKLCAQSVTASQHNIERTFDSDKMKENFSRSPYLLLPLALVFTLHYNVQGVLSCKKIPSDIHHFSDEAVGKQIPLRIRSYVYV